MNSEHTVLAFVDKHFRGEFSREIKSRKAEVLPSGELISVRIQPNTEMVFELIPAI